MMTRVFALIAFAFFSPFSFAADYAQAGALAKNGNWEISVVFDLSVQRSLLESNYVLPTGAQLADIREQPLDNGVILSVTGLATNAAYTITLTNMQTTAGAALPNLRLSFTTRPMSWAAIGSQEFGFTAEGLAVGDTGFDLVSGGTEMFNMYDESTFAYEVINRDFDKRVRVDSQEASSAEARAGLMVREVLDELKSRPLDPTDPAQQFSRYLQIQVNPVKTDYTDFDGSEVPGRNLYQINFRSLPGGATDQPATDTNAPAYPNAWMRLKRVGQTFHVFRGNDGTNWVRLGTFTFPATDLDGNAVPAFSASAYVGPNYSPEIGNIPESTGERRAFLARFREYSNASGDVEIEQPQLTIARNGDQIEVRWSAGTVQSSTNIASNAWIDLGTASPLTLTPDKHYQFFRARNP